MTLRQCSQTTGVVGLCRIRRQLCINVVRVSREFKLPGVRDYSRCCGDFVGMD